MHELLVFALGVVHQCHGWLRQRRQPSDFARMVHAQFNHTQPVRMAQTQQRQGHPDVVVEVATGGQHLVFCCSPGGCAQNGRNHLRHGGFAIAAGHSNQRQGELAAPLLRQLPQGRFGVGYFHTRQSSLLQTVLGQSRHGAHGFGLRQEIVCVETVAAQGHEQVAGLQTACVGVHAQNVFGQGAYHPGAGQLRQQAG